MNNKTSDAQKAATARWDAANKERKNYNRNKSGARSYVRDPNTTRDDLNELIKLFENENPNARND